MKHLLGCPADNDPNAECRCGVGSTRTEAQARTEISLNDQISCVRRELALRRNVYAKRVGDGKMTKLTADRELASMQSVHDTLMSLLGASKAETNAEVVEEINRAWNHLIRSTSLVERTKDGVRERLTEFCVQLSQIAPDWRKWRDGP